MRRLRLILPAAAALLLGACASKPSEPVPAALPQVEATLASADVTEVTTALEAGGLVKARTTAVISPRIVAPVLRVLVAPGDHVKRGQPLVLLDDRDLRAQQSRARSGVIAGEQMLKGARAEEQAAAAGLALARATHDRIATLASRKSATAQELDEAVAALKGAEGRAAGATARVAEADAGLAASRAGAEGADVMASYSTLTAPFDGVVASKTCEPGNIVAPGAPLLTVEDTSAFRMEVRIDEARVQQVAMGQEVAVLLDAAPTAPPLAGKVEEVARTADPGAHSVLVKIALPASAAVRSGQFGRARLSGESRRVLTVPADAIVRRGQLTLTWAADAEGRARLHPVSLGATSGDRVEVLAGLEPGDRVVRAPAVTIIDGSPIRGLSPASKAAPAAEKGR